MFNYVYHAGKFVGLEHHLYSGFVQQQFTRLVWQWYCQTAWYCLIFAARTWIPPNRGWNYSASSQPNHRREPPSAKVDTSSAGTFLTTPAAEIETFAQILRSRLVVSPSEKGGTTTSGIQKRSSLRHPRHPLGSCSTPKSGRSSFQNASELLFELVWTNKVL